MNVSFELGQYFQAHDSINVLTDSYFQAISDSDHLKSKNQVKTKKAGVKMKKKRGKRRKRKKKRKSKSIVCVEEDRISALPDEILHHIFSSFYMTEIVRTSILSKRWRYLWTTTPYLKFNSSEPCFRIHGTNDYDCNRFKCFVDNVFLRRDNSTIIHKFKAVLFRSSSLLNSCLLNSWLIKSLESHVQIINLNADREPKPLELPDHLFTSEVKMLRLCGSLFAIPDMMCSAANITSLCLEMVKLPDGNRNGELILSLPILEDLTMNACGYNELNCLTIKCSLLERFEMFNGSTHGSRTLNIRCPNLTSIKLTICIGSIFKVCSLENLSALSSANITVEKEDTIHAQHLMEILKGVSNVNALTLSPTLVKTIAGSPEIIEMLPNLLHNVTDFILDDMGDDRFISVIPDILKKLPCVEAFVWNRTSNLYRSTKKVQHWEEQLSVIQSKICRLKTVEIHNFSWSEEELNVLEFILKTAICLKEVNLFTSEFTEEELEELEEKLLDLPHASSNVSIWAF